MSTTTVVAVDLFVTTSTLVRLGLAVVATECLRQIPELWVGLTYYLVESVGVLLLKRVSARAQVEVEVEAEAFSPARR